MEALLNGKDEDIARNTIDLAQAALVPAEVPGGQSGRMAEPEVVVTEILFAVEPILPAASLLLRNRTSLFESGPRQQ